MASVLICRNCGSRAAAELASNEQDLANVGMLERHCLGCATVTRWGLAQDYRRHDRRMTERRRADGGIALNRRQGNRRSGDRRSAE